MYTLPERRHLLEKILILCNFVSFVYLECCYVKRFESIFYGRVHKSYFSYRKETYDLMQNDNYIFLIVSCKSSKSLIQTLHVAFGHFFLNS